MSIRYLLLGLLESLKNCGVDIVSVSAAGDEVAVIESKGIRHISIPITRKALSPISDAHTLLSLYKIMKSENFTIVHTHFHKSGIYGRIAAKLAGVPIIIHTNHGLIFHERSHWIWRRLFIFLEKIAGYCSDLIFSVNQEDIQTLICEGITSPEKVKLLGRGGIGINLNRFNPVTISDLVLDRTRLEIGIPSNVKVVCFVGRLVKEKGVLDLLMAAKLVINKFPDVIFLFVGPADVEKADALNSDLACKYGVYDKCIFTGKRDDMPIIYMLSDICILPSYREGFGMVLAEAAAMGKPVIATNIRGCREAVEDGRNGVLVPPGNFKLLADAILDLLTDEEKSHCLGEEGKKIALERFDERKVFDKVKHEYARLLNEKGFSVPVELR